MGPAAPVGTYDAAGLHSSLPTSDADHLLRAPPSPPRRPRRRGPRRGLAVCGAPALAQDDGAADHDHHHDHRAARHATRPVETHHHHAPPDPRTRAAARSCPRSRSRWCPTPCRRARPSPACTREQAGRIVRQQLHVAEADAVALETTYKKTKQRVVDLEAELDRLEGSITGLADDRPRRRAARRGRPPAVRGRGRRRPSSAAGPRTWAALIATDDPNDIAIAQTLLGSVLDADDQAVRDYLDAKGEVSADLVGVAERLVDARLELEDARTRLVESRRASGGGAVQPRRVRRRVGDRHPRVRVPGRRPAQLRDSLRCAADDGHGLRARPPGHGHHGAVRHAAPGLRARHRHRDGHRRARWHEALAQGRERHVLLLRPPQRLRRGPHRRHARRGRRRRRARGRHRQREGRCAAPALRDPPRRRHGREPLRRCSRSSTSSASRPRHASA